MRAWTIVALIACWSLAPGAFGAGSTVRVGILVDASQVRIDAPGSDLLVVTEPQAQGKRRPGPVIFGLKEGPVARVAWEIRVSQESARKKADLVRGALADALRLPLRVEREGSFYEVVAGPFDDEPRARAVLADLAEAGMDGATLRRTGGNDDGAGGNMRMVTGAWEVVPIPSDHAWLSTADGTAIQVDGKPHRGSVEVRAGANGLLTVILEADFEDYLRGVVPAELGPEAYPAIEALRSQAVAARTYALMPAAHGANGFERCATAHCQVYGGVSSEHPLSDRAVADTRGLILTHEGRPIHAYFSSTCGGRTEDVANVFTGDAQPYLRGVPCYPEKVEFLRVPGRQMAVDFTRVDGRTAHGVLARLIAAGVVSEDEAKLGVFSRRARGDEAIAWLRRAAVVSGTSLDGSVTSLNVDSTLSFLRSMLQATGGLTQVRLLEAQDFAAAARFREMQGLSGDDLTTALLALKGGMLPEGLEPGWGQSRLSRGNVLELIEGWLRARGHLAPAPVRFLSARSGALQVLAGTETRSVSVAPGVILLSGRAGAPQRMRESLELKLGDRLRIHSGRDGIARCIELDEDPDGASLDRLSAYSWWTRRIEAAKLVDGAATHGVGDLRDLRITRISDAGRVVGLELVGGGGNAKTLEGFAVRQYLGIPDSRADVRIEREGDGRLVAVTATGRGWGHGVGLCQVGAFGMALQGRSYQEILAHYYPGTLLQVLGAADVGNGAGD